VIAPIDLDPPKPRDAPKHFFQERGIWFTFIPELPIAVVLVLATPVWAVTLMLHDHVAAGVMLVAGVAPLSYGAYRAMQANEKWLTYLSIVGILIIGYMVGANT
jgi:hypothetical protein